MNIMVAIICGVIQDADNDSYERVTIVYVVLAMGSAVTSFVLIVMGWWSVDLGRLQWTRKQRLARGHIINERNEVFHKDNGHRNRLVSKACFASLILLVLGSWCAYFWGVATGNNY